MNEASLDASRSQVPPVSAVPAGIINVVIVAVVAACLLAIYDDAIGWMLKRWQADEYNHAYMIPFVAFYLFWLRAKALQALNPVGSWLGPVVIGLGLLLQLLGAFSAIFEISQYGLVVVHLGHGDRSGRAAQHAPAVGAAGLPGIHGAAAELPRNQPDRRPAVAVLADRRAGDPCCRAERVPRRQCHRSGQLSSCRWRKPAAACATCSR